MYVIHLREIKIIKRLLANYLSICFLIRLLLSFIACVFQVNFSKLFTINLLVSLCKWIIFRIKSNSLSKLK